MDMSAMLPLFMSMMGGGKNGMDPMGLMNMMMNQNKNNGSQNAIGGMDMGAMMNMMSAMMGNKNSAESPKKEESPFKKYADNPNFQNENYGKEEPPVADSPVPPHIMQMLNLLMNMKKAP